MSCDNDRCSIRFNLTDAEWSVLPSPSVLAVTASGQRLFLCLAIRVPNPCCPRMRLNPGRPLCGASSAPFPAVYGFFLATNQTPYRDQIFIQRIIGIGEKDGFIVNPVFVSLFSIMGIYPAIYASLLVPAGRSENKVRQSRTTDKTDKNGFAARNVNTITMVIAWVNRVRFVKKGWGLSS